MGYDFDREHINPLMPGLDAPETHVKRANDIVPTGPGRMGFRVPVGQYSGRTGQDTVDELRAASAVESRTAHFADGADVSGKQRSRPITWGAAKAKGKSKKKVGLAY